MINHKENTDTYTYLAEEWEITKRALAGKIRQYDKDQLWDATHALAAEWVPTDIGTLEAFKTKSLDRFDITSEEFPGLGHLNGGNVARYTAFENINQLVYRANAIGVLDSLDPKDETRLDLFRELQRIAQCIECQFRTAANYEEFHSLRNQPSALPHLYDGPFEGFRVTLCPWFNGRLRDKREGALSPLQQCEQYVLLKMYEDNCRRDGSNLLIQKISPDGFNTHSWVKLDTIDEYVKSKLGEGPIQMIATKQKKTIKDTTDFFTNECRDDRLPDVQKDRHAWSFRNGIFLGRLHDCRFIAYGSDEFREIPESLVTAKYFDYEYDAKYETMDWREIPTPEFDTILKYQKLDKGTMEWLYAMGGRLTFDVKEADGWDVVFYVKGLARTGKSTIITQGFKKFYDQIDVKTISNKIEPVFGLSACTGGFLCIGPEIKANFTLSQSDFQSMISGEDVALAVKHEKRPMCIEWKTPCAFAGNEMPGWADAGGSIVRRIVCFPFRRQVQKADAKLQDRLNKEVPLLLVKCVRAYIEFAKKHADVGNIWDVLPKQLVDVRKEIEESCSYLDRFLNSKEAMIGDGRAVPAAVFRDVYLRYLRTTCGQRNPPKGGLTSDYIAGPFQKKGIYKEERNASYQMYNETKVYEGDWYINVDVKHDELHYENH